MAVTDGWTERTLRPAGEGRTKARSAPRSLGAALRDAGLGDAAPDPHEDETTETASPAIPALRASSVIARSRSPRLAVFAEPEPVAPVKTSPSPPQGVVSPPPWLRAARRGRWHQRMLNTFGWVMTLVVAGSIIGVAGRYLALPPLGVESTLQARQ